MKKYFAKVIATGCIIFITGCRQDSPVQFASTRWSPYDLEVSGEHQRALREAWKAAQIEFKKFEVGPLLSQESMYDVKIEVNPRVFQVVFSPTKIQQEKNDAWIKNYLHDSHSKRYEFQRGLPFGNFAEIMYFINDDCKIDTSKPLRHNY